jgi:hypothetical protein
MPQVLTPQTEPAKIEQPAPSVQAPVAPKEDLVTRASKVNLDTPKKDESNQTESIQFNVKDLERIADPNARKLAEDAYKSFQADYTRKTQALAEKSKNADLTKSELESLRQQVEQARNKVYDIPSLLNDPQWVQKAAEYQQRNPISNAPVNGGDLTQEEISYLTPEQQKLYLKTKEVEQTNQAILSKLNSSEQARVFQEQDNTLKSKYANYQPQTVDEIYNGMMNGKIQATREHLWKVADYDAAVERAYKLGLEDRNLNLGEKLNASSQPSGVSVTPSNDVPVRNQNESGVEYFKRIAMNNAQKLIRK